MTIHPFKTPEKDVLATIRALAADSAKVVITRHVTQRMTERGITRTQIDRCLQSGSLREPAETETNGDWRVTLEHRTAGVRVTVAAVLAEDETGKQVIVVTAF